VNYKFKAVKRFWKSFHALNAEQREAAQYAFAIFKADPFDFRLRTHKINRLSRIARHPVLSAEIDRDLRVIFRIDGDVVTTLDVGTHDVYKPR
jgi:mRNA-degrading endonuclease YafQ of YafQ-DinJ toxin-antitoxin module